VNRVKIAGIHSAATFFPRFWGLMGKREWPGGWGGIYFPDCRSLHTFFTYLRPDIVFLDKQRKILKIIPLAGPWRTFWGPLGSQNCLELPGGTAEKLTLKTGDHVQI
jgi:uncharacterized protein